MSNELFNFFGVLFNPKAKDKAVRVLRIRLSADLQRDLSNKFAEIAEDLNEREIVDYQSTFYRVDKELIRRRPFQLPEEYTSAFADLQAVPTLAFPLPDGYDLKAIVAHRMGETLFQGHTAQRELSKSRWALVQSGETFSRFDRAGLMIGNTLAAIVRGTDLLINTFSQVQDILKLKDMYRQASDADIRTFLAHNLFEQLDEASTKLVADTLGTTARKRISSVLADGVLSAVTVQQLKEYSAKYPDAGTLNVAITGGVERIVLPTTASGVSKVIDLLTGSYFTHELSGQACATNSFRPLSKPSVVSIPSAKSGPQTAEPAEPKKPKPDTKKRSPRKRNPK